MRPAWFAHGFAGRAAARSKQRRGVLALFWVSSQSSGKEGIVAVTLENRACVNIGWCCLHIADAMTPSLRSFQCGASSLSFSSCKICARL